MYNYPSTGSDRDNLESAFEQIYLYGELVFYLSLMNNDNFIGVFMSIFLTLP